MTYCPSCRVTLADDCMLCPLCQAPSVISDGPLPDITATHSDEIGIVQYSPYVQNADQGEKLTIEEQRFIISELLAVSFGIILVITVGVDFLVSNTVTWSKYTSLILGTLWLFLAMPLVLWGHPWLVFAILAPSLPAVLFLMAFFSGDVSWFILLALPITLVVEAVVLSSFVLIAHEKQKGLNCVGIILGALAVLCVGIDVILGRYLSGTITLEWSVVVMVSLLPVAGFFFYLHYRVTKKATLRKLFRL